MTSYQIGTFTYVACAVLCFVGYVCITRGITLVIMIIIPNSNIINFHILKSQEPGWRQYIQMYLINLCFVSDLV